MDGSMRRWLALFRRRDPSPASRPLRFTHQKSSKCLVTISITNNLKNDTGNTLASI